jgi:uncharacterized membrane protein
VPLEHERRWQEHHSGASIVPRPRRYLNEERQMTDPQARQNNPGHCAPAAAGSLSDRIDQNIEAVVALQRREWEQTSVSQRRVEWVGRFIGRPLYLVTLLCLAALWIAVNVGTAHFGYAPLDPVPFEMLQGMLSLVALITTTIVLIAQNRQTKLEQQHTHLGLQVNLLTEQKVTKLILLIEELRRDMPMVKDRHDPQAVLLQEGADTKQVLSAIEEVGLTDDLEKPQLKPGSSPRHPRS